MHIIFSPSSHAAATASAPTMAGSSSQSIHFVGVPTLIIRIILLSMSMGPAAGLAATVATFASLVSSERPAQHLVALSLERLPVNVS